MTLVAAAVSFASTSARAGDGPTKEQCLDAHSRGQDAREAAQLSLARKLFLTCAQSTCPNAVQGDCARFSEDLIRLQSTVSFAARESNEADVPDTTVYVDGVLFATRLDDGKIHDVDPGRHTVRFVNGTREVTMTVVVNQGEKGRPIVATFPAPDHPSFAVASEKPVPVPEARRPIGPLVLAGIGGAVAAGGIAMIVVGLAKVPSNCSLSTHDCAAPPGDSSFGSASTSVTVADIGIGVGAAGAAALVSGLLWYFESPKTVRQGKLLTPWFGDRAGGVAFGTSF